MIIMMTDMLILFDDDDGYYYYDSYDGWDDDDCSMIKTMMIKAMSHCPPTLSLKRLAQKKKHGSLFSFYTTGHTQRYYVGRCNGEETSGKTYILTMYKIP